MLRAVPAMIFSAPSTLVALRSDIFCSANWRNCLRVIEPTAPRLGVPEPRVIPAALRNKSDAGGGLEHKGERAIAVHGDFDGDGATGL